MAVRSATRLGPYEVLSSVGAGAMGEVYRARDPRLGRDVAVKVLPESFSSDAQRLHRFEQEARAAAGLNHPNILAVYDIGEQDGAPYIVSELLEGETLRQKLMAGPIPVRKAVEYALQLARGLGAAHEKGIVHRDLKPENIFVTRDGRVKILDFGLAKLTRPEAAPDGATLTMHSDVGTVVGTVGYMAPEQVRGKAADARADLFALGAVLYEMLTGKRAFQGDTSADTMTAILTKDPPELGSASAQAPPALDRIVRHCLEKSPEERFQSARDVAFDLETLSSMSGSGSSEAVPVRRAKKLPTRVVIAIALAMIATALVAAVLATRYGASPAMPARFHRITYERGSVVMARFAPDGHSVIYEAAWEGKAPQLFSTPATAPEPRTLDLKDAHLFAVSPSGEAALGLGGSLASHLIIRGATLARSPLGGGAPRELLQDVMAAEWGPDGNLAVAHFVGGKMLLEYPIGKALYQTSGWVSDVRVSPSGDKLAFLDHPYWPDDRGWVAVVDLAGNKKILSGEWEAEDGLAWAPGGKEIWFTATKAGIDRSLYAVTLSGKQRLVLTVPGSLRLYDVYSDGRVLLSAGHERVGMIGVTPADENGHDLSWSGWTIPADISRDGKWVLFNEQSEFAGPNYMVAMRQMDGSPPIKLGDGNADRYSPDGEWVTSAMPGESSRFMLLPTGAGEPKEVKVAGLDRLVSAITLSNGKFMVAGAERGHAMRCYLLAASGEALKPITAEGSWPCAMSPDVGNVAARDRGANISIYPLDGGATRTLPATQKMMPIRWTNNHTLLAHEIAALPARVVEIDLATGKQTVIKTLAPGDRAGVSQVQSVAATPDGRTFAFSYQQALYELYVVEGLK